MLLVPSSVAVCSANFRICAGYAAVRKLECVRASRNLSALCNAVLDVPLASSQAYSPLSLSDRHPLERSPSIVFVLKAPSRVVC